MNYSLVIVILIKMGIEILTCRHPHGCSMVTSKSGEIANLYDFAVIRFISFLNFEIFSVTMK
jgi:hypothetical protein